MPLIILYLIGCSSDLEDLKKYLNSFYNVKNNVMNKKPVNVQEQLVIENGVPYKFYYVPIENTLKMMLSDSLVMDNLFKWHNSK